MNARPAELCVTPDVVPKAEAELRACLASWDWRIFSGWFHRITKAIMCRSGGARPSLYSRQTCPT